MKNFTKVFMTLYMLTLIAVPVAGNTLPHEPITPEPGISTCSINTDPSQSIIEDDDRYLPQNQITCKNRKD